MVRKFRNVGDMDRLPVLETDPHRLVARVAELYELSRALCPGLFTGVHKFRDMEESNRFRLEWMRARVRRNQRRSG
ncbi:MAG: hypothetical protein FJX76_26720 [Armatimonadetes bacterium]|nr:hypothetical protein [Armatimonadota bacterium]